MLSEPMKRAILIAREAASKRAQFAVLPNDDWEIVREEIGPLSGYGVPLADRTFMDQVGKPHFLLKGVPMIAERNA